MQRGRKRLGKGLDALLPGYSDRGVEEVDISRIVPNPYQPRREFDDDALGELAESIRVHGVVQPLILRPTADQMFELVAGERRWRAARIAGLTAVPAVVREMDDADMLQVALIENLQREDLNPVEEARAYQVLLDQFGLTQDDLARRVGKSRPQVANTLRLLQLEDEILSMVEAGQLSMGHAKVLLGVGARGLRLNLARQAGAGALTVRQLEEVAKKGRGGKKAPPGPRQDPATRDLQEHIMRRLGTRVLIRKGKRKGRLEIEFFGLDDLHRILEICGLIEPS